MTAQIYPDYNATTPFAPEVVAAMQPFLTSAYGNPSSLHWAGKPGREAVETARRQVASLLDCGASEIVFTSGGTEANDLAIKGLFFRQALSCRPHASPVRLNIRPCSNRAGSLNDWRCRDPDWRDRFGRVDPDDVRRSIRPDISRICDARQ